MSRVIQSIATWANLVKVFICAVAFFAAALADSRYSKKEDVAPRLTQLEQWRAVSSSNQERNDVQVKEIKAELYKITEQMGDLKTQAAVNNAMLSNQSKTIERMASILESAARSGGH